MQPLIEEVKVGTKSLELVRELWRSHSSTLGFFPDGAFEDACRRRSVLAALDSSGMLCGYLLFRTTRDGRAILVHLCVAPEFRGSGVTRMLFSALIGRLNGCHEIRLQCRRDFDANKLWPKLGFVAVGETSAKKEGRILVVWRYQLRQLPLLSLLSQGQHSAKVQIVLDANVFFDLDESKSNASKGLMADWLTETIEPVLTEEILNEINRQEDQKLREHHRVRAQRFRILQRDVGRETMLFERVRKMLPDDGRVSTDSDARQIAMGIAADVTFLVTQDKVVLARAEAIESEFGLEVLQPHEVISRFDELHRAETYRPGRFSLGANSRSRSARSDDVDKITDLLHRGETVSQKRNVTRAALKEMLAHPSDFDLRLFEKDDDLLAFIAIDKRTRGELRVPYFGVQQSPIGTTAAHHFVQFLVDEAGRRSSQLIRVRTNCLCDSALSVAGFLSTNEGDWIKLGFASVAPASETRSLIQQNQSLAIECAELLTQTDSQLELLESMEPGTDIAVAAALSVEKALWPAKVTNIGVACSVVPIQPRWAKELFDHLLAEGTLFGGTPHLMFNAENVYYRAPRPRIVSSPSRILWYVSADRAYQGSMTIRAASYVEEATVGSARDLFRRFRRLGIYTWQDVLKIAKGDPDGDVMAFRFSRTEVFPTPVAWDTIQEVLVHHQGKSSQFQTPLAISEECFFDLYRRGKFGGTS